MGYTSYSVENRSMRSTSMGYHTKDVDEIFVQNKKRQIHESMNPEGIKFRECRDSEAHPNSTPIIIALDVTGSMGEIPHEMIKDGLPTMMSKLIEEKVEDAAVLFVAVGDHVYDRAPLQVGQFESGDEELDMWLARTYLEGGGGGNFGESYHLAWYLAARHTAMDSLEKRNRKGFLFTIGDEPVLKTLPKSAIKEIFNEDIQDNINIEDLLEEVQQKYNVFHLHITEGFHGEDALKGWQTLLGQRCIKLSSYKKVAETIASTVLSHKTETQQTVNTSTNSETETML